MARPSAFLPSTLGFSGPRATLAATHTTGDGSRFGAAKAIPETADGVAPPATTGTQLSIGGRVITGGDVGMTLLDKAADYFIGVAVGQTNGAIDRSRSS